MYLKETLSGNTRNTIAFQNPFTNAAKIVRGQFLPTPRRLFFFRKKWTKCRGVLREKKNWQDKAYLISLHGMFHPCLITLTNILPLPSRFLL